MSTNNGLTLFKQGVRFAAAKRTPTAFRRLDPFRTKCAFRRGKTDTRRHSEQGEIGGVCACVFVCHNNWSVRLRARPRPCAGASVHQSGLGRG